MPFFRDINVNGAGDGLDANQARLRTLTSLGIDVPEFGLESQTISDLKSRQGESNDEAASRLLLQTFLEDTGNETMLEVTSPERAEVVPDMRLRTTTATPDLNANTVTFQQSAAAIPIFGGRVIVDVGAADKSLVAINGKVATVPQLSPVATLSVQQALERLADWGRVPPTLIAPTTAPQLTWFLDEAADHWHLIYRFAAVPMLPRDDSGGVAAAAPGPDASWGCMGESVDPMPPAYDYFVDANDGTMVYCFSIRSHVDIPIPMTGLDYANQPRDFFGLQVGNGFALIDPIRRIETYDYGNSDLSANPPPQFPPSPISVPSANLGNASRAAVSAHYHATVVFDFYNDVLKRKSVDDKGMKLISVVNVDYRSRNPAQPPQWRNAVWSQDKMWYGQVPSAGGQLESLARHLDVIGHELTHGVTQSTAGLVYRDLPGALNESFSDIFGVLIANWFPGGPNALAGWSWQIGAGLGRNGGPLRDFSNPAAAGQPAHMNQYVPLPLSNDNGGVHIYSGIHNKAVHGLLTAKDANGDIAFPTAEAALLLYLTLTRLTQTSDFRAARRTLENVAGVYYGQKPAVKAARLAVIAAAYGAVGIV